MEIGWSENDTPELVPGLYSVMEAERRVSGYVEEAGDCKGLWKEGRHSKLRTPFKTEANLSPFPVCIPVLFWCRKKLGGQV